MKKITFFLCLFFFDVSAQDFRYYLSLCAIFQNEAPYLKEWIEFHKLVGVQHFYLINNLSTDNYRSVLAPYLKRKEVTLINWPYSHEGKIWAKTQTNAYNYVLPRLSSSSHWVAFLDLDEYLVPMKDKHLHSILKEYESFGGVCVNWQFYGTSFVKKIPANKLLIESLIRRAPETDLSQLAVKSIVNPRRVISTAQHNFVYKKPYFQVDTAKNKFSGPASPQIRYDVMKVAHYWTRDEEYFEKFKIPRRCQIGKKIDVYERKNSANIVEDYSVVQFASALRPKIFGQV